MTRPSDQEVARPAEQQRADARQNRALLISAATAAFAEKGADAPLEDIARRAGVGIQVRDVCAQGDALLATDAPQQAFAAWARALTGYLVTKRGLSRALIDAVGVESELITSCWMTMRDTTERLLESAQRAGVIRPDVTAVDVMRLLHGVAVSSEKDPSRTDLLLSVMLDGLAAAGQGEANRPGRG